MYCFLRQYLSGCKTAVYGIILQIYLPSSSILLFIHYRVGEKMYFNASDSRMDNPNVLPPIWVVQHGSKGGGVCVGRGSELIGFTL